MANILCEYPIRAIYPSPMRRSCQTISPFAERLDLTIDTAPDLQERRLGDGVFEDIFKAVEATWRNLSFAHSGGESSGHCPTTRIALVQRLLEQHPAERIVLSTHGDLTALILQTFDSSVDFMFWKSLTMSDIYKLNINQSGKAIEFSSR